MSIARRMADIAPFHVMELMARAKALEAQGRDIVHMEVGEPDFPTPQPVIEAAQRFIAGGQVHYTHALGLPQLREAIAGFYQRPLRRRRGAGTHRRHRRRLRRAAAGAGRADRPRRRGLAGRSRLSVQPPFRARSRRSCRADSGRREHEPTSPPPSRSPPHWTPRTRAVLVASPANPTGTLIEPCRNWRHLRDVVRARGGTLLVDEIYHGLTYGCDAETALALGDDIFVINSFSKYFGMTGWRLGWLVAPPHACARSRSWRRTSSSRRPHRAQHAALAAFRPETLAILEARRVEFERAPRHCCCPACGRSASRSRRNRRARSTSMRIRRDWRTTASPGGAAARRSRRRRHARPRFRQLRAATAHALCLHGSARTDRGGSSAHGAFLPRSAIARAGHGSPGNKNGGYITQPPSLTGTFPPIPVGRKSGDSNSKDAAALWGIPARRSGRTRTRRERPSRRRIQRGLEARRSSGRRSCRCRSAGAAGLAAAFFAAGFLAAGLAAVWQQQPSSLQAWRQPSSQRAWRQPSSRRASWQQPSSVAQPSSRRASWQQPSSLAGFLAAAFFAAGFLAAAFFAAWRSLLGGGLLGSSLLRRGSLLRSGLRQQPSSRAAFFAAGLAAAFFAGAAFFAAGLAAAAFFAGGLGGYGLLCGRFLRRGLLGFLLFSHVEPPSQINRKETHHS